MNHATTATSHTSRSTGALVIALSISFLLYKYALQLFPGLITEPLTQTFHLSALSLGNLTACYFYAYLVVQIIAGPLLDQFPIRVLTPLVIAMAALGVMIFSYAHSLSALMIGRLLMGFGSAFATVCYMKMTVDFFTPKQFGRIGGLLTLGVMLGAVLGEAPLAELIHHTDWRTGIRIIAIVGLALSVTYLAFPKSTQATQTHPRINKKHLLGLIASKKNQLLLLYSGMAFAPLAVFGGLWGTPFLKAVYHLNTLHASSLITLTYMGFGLGGPLFGWLADRDQTHFRYMRQGLILSFVCLTLTLYCPSHTTWLLSVWLFGLGLGTGGFMLGFTVAKTSNPLFLAASVVALVNTGDAFFGAVTEPLVGYFLDTTKKHLPSSTHSTHLFSVTDFHVALAILPIYLVLAYGCLSCAEKMASTSLAEKE